MAKDAEQSLQAALQLAAPFSDLLLGSQRGGGSRPRMHLLVMLFAGSSAHNLLLPAPFLFPLPPASPHQLHHPRRPFSALPTLHRGGAAAAESVPGVLCRAAGIQLLLQAAASPSSVLSLVTRSGVPQLPLPLLAEQAGGKELPYRVPLRVSSSFAPALCPRQG